MKVKPFLMTMESYGNLSENNGGYCVACREEASGVEPDARRYVCKSCGEPQVYGAEELMLRGIIQFTE